MRALLVLGCALALSGCRPSATVQGTSPVANLQPYRGLLVRGTGASERGSGQLAMLLERAASARIHARCAFLDVRIGSEPERGSPDLILDLTVQRAFRGGDGLVQNQNMATVDVKMVLSDGIDEELIGSADIRGKSSGVVINNESPEGQAIDAVADSIASILVSSGCAGPRVARRTRPSTPVASPGPPPGPGEPDDAGARAEAENEEGKRLFRSADVAAAKTHFEAAISLHKDPRYVFNLCLAEEALGELDAAVSACESVLDMKPGDALGEKVKLRLSLIAQKQGK